MDEYTQALRVSKNYHQSTAARKVRALKKSGVNKRIAPAYFGISHGWSWLSDAMEFIKDAIHGVPYEGDHVHFAACKTRHQKQRKHLDSCGYSVQLEISMTPVRFTLHNGNGAHGHFSLNLVPYKQSRSLGLQLRWHRVTTIRSSLSDRFVAT